MTCYENGHDYIGPHSDKADVGGRLFISCGEVGMSKTLCGHLKDESSTVLFDKILPEGTEIVVVSANEATEHAVPQWLVTLAISGSICGEIDSD